MNGKICDIVWLSFEDENKCWWIKALNGKKIERLFDWFYLSLNGSTEILL